MKILFKASQNAFPQWQHYLLGLGLALISVVCQAGTVAQAPLFLTTNTKPNIMLMVDNSGSMSTNVAPIPTVYNSATTYLASADCTVNALLDSTKTTVTVNLNTKQLCEVDYGYKWDPKKNRCSVRTITSDKFTPITYNTSVPTGFVGSVSKVNGVSTKGKLCFSSAKTYTVSGITFPSGVTTNTQRANYLNWYYTEKLAQASTGSSRLQIAKDAAVGLVNSLNNNVRMGLTTFNGTEGGTLLEVIDDLGPTKKSYIVNRINALTASSYTPLAETTAGIGRYFATGNAGDVLLKAGTADETKVTLTNVLDVNLVNGTAWSGRTAIPAQELSSSTEPVFTTAPIQAWCQKCFAVLITDGLPTQDRNIKDALKDYDGDCSGTHSGDCLSVSPNYDLKKAFFKIDSRGNTLSIKDTTVYTDTNTDHTTFTSDFLDDVGQALFEIDLRPDLVPKALPNGTIPKKRNNITTYTIGLADPEINPTTPGVNPILKETADQGGGDFFFAGSAAELTASLQTAFEAIVRQDASSSSVAANSTQFRTGALLFQALFNSSDWSGNIKAFNLITEDVNGNGKLDSGEDTNGNGKIDAGAIGSLRWSADERIPLPNDRHIFSFDAATGLGIDFDWGSLNITQKTVLDNTNKSNSTSPIMDFLRGVQTNEGTGSGKYRERGSVLGDIVNSDPLFVSGEDLGYTSLSGAEGLAYPAHVLNKKDNQEMLYVGANDGMLHGFKVSFNDPAVVTNDEGVEQFAYVPNAVISQELVTLTEQNYSHRYFVDGSAQNGDAYYDGSWHSLLVGGMGAGSTTAVASSTSLATGVGGRGIFALDITDPQNFNKTNVLWEFTNRQDADLGYIMQRNSIVRMATGQWAVIVANGYNSTNGKSVLFFLDAKTGTIIQKIVANSGPDNGLSGATPIDADGDKVIDYIYAGDLKGNLWKFDVTSNTAQVAGSTAAGQWRVAYSGNPLFVAVDSSTSANRQPITVIPAVAKASNTVAGQTSGNMVYFGTGKYFESGDHSAASQQTQTFYGIWDVCDKSSTSSCNGVVSGRSVLQQQSILLEGSSSFTGISSKTVTEDIRITTNCDVIYGSSGPAPTTTAAPCSSTFGRKGWFIDLIPPGKSATNQGERVVSNPIIRNDSIIFPTLIPITEVCAPSGTGWLMELQLSGSRFAGSPIDLNQDGTINDNDLVLFEGQKVAASGMKSKVGVIKTPAVINCEDGLDCKYLTGSSGDLMTLKEKAPGGTPATPAGNKRISWRQLR